MVPEELSHESQCCPLVSALLNQDVEHFAFAIHGAPQVHLPATNIHENLVDVPMIKDCRTAFADPAGVGLPEFQHPQTDRLIADVDSSLREKILDIPVAHRKTKIDPNGFSDYVGMKAVATV